MGSTAGDDTLGNTTTRAGAGSDERVESAVQRIVRLATKLLSVRMAAVSVVVTGRPHIEAAIGINAAALGRDLPLHDDTLSRDRVLCVLDAKNDGRFAEHPLVVGHPHVRFFAAAPLRAADGRVLGALFVLDATARAEFSNDEGDTLRDLAAMIAAHVDARQAIGHTAPVTGLANRVRLVHDVASFIQNDGGQRSPLTLAVIETSTPHEYSELIRVFGASCADAFERESSRIIRQTVPPSTRLYHLSVGRFACVFTEETEGVIADVFPTEAEARAWLDAPATKPS